MAEHKQNKVSVKSTYKTHKPPQNKVTPPISSPVAIIQRVENDPGSLTRTDIIQLQQTIGNQATGNLIQEIVQNKSLKQKTKSIATGGPIQMLREDLQVGTSLRDQNGKTWTIEEVNTPESKYYLVSMTENGEILQVAAPFGTDKYQVVEDLGGAGGLGGGLQPGIILLDGAGLEWAITDVDSEGQLYKAVNYAQGQTRFVGFADASYRIGNSATSNLGPDLTEGTYIKDDTGRLWVIRAVAESYYDVLSNDSSLENKEVNFTDPSYIAVSKPKDIEAPNVVRDGKKPFG